MIGGASVGLYQGQSVTELDSHANMAVAGQDCTIIARSGHYATVTPFLEDLPVMEKVEIGDVATTNEECVVDFINGSQPTPSISGP